MKRLLIGLALLTASPALGKSLILDMRGELDSESYNTAAREGGESNSSRFLLHTARIDFRGDLSENVTYRFRTRLNSESTSTGVDSLSNRIDYAMLTHKMDKVSLTMGKFVTDVGGHETIGDSREVYFKSEANKALTGTYNSLITTTGPAFYQVKYDTGAKVGVKLGDSELIVLGANNPEADSDATPNPHNRFLAGAVWKGKYDENRWQPILSYHSYKSSLDSASGTDGSETKLMAAGLKWTDSGHFAQIDYVLLDAGDLSLNTNPSDMKIQSWVVEGGYRWDEWRVKAKAELSKISESPEGAEAVHNDVQGLGLAFEYFPLEDQDFRYHLALTQKTFKQEEADALSESHLLLGMAFGHDFLK